jgi:hypothetical protein
MTEEIEYFWLIMLAIWIVFVLLSLIERSRIEALLVAVVGIIFYILHEIEKRSKKEGKYANRSKK